MSEGPTLHLEAKIDGVVVASHDCRPAPSHGTTEYAQCIRAFLDELEPHLPPGEKA